VISQTPYCKVNNALFISCVFSGIFQSRKTLVCYAEGAPPILYVAMFPWSYSFSMDKERSEEIKRELFM
jgi:hypothetical protein